jgi:uncharacterized membrane protein
MVKRVKTIGNPASWAMDALFGVSRHVGDALHEIEGDHLAPPVVARLDDEDLRVALRKGRDDFFALRTDVIFIIILYPIIGLVLSAIAFQRDLLPLLFPLMSGFALLGPVAAVGLYEMSRRRERGEPAGFGAAIGVLGSPAIGAILAIGLGLVLFFVVWVLAAYLIYALTLGPEPPISVSAFFTDVFTTGAGWTMLIVGCGVGFVFAACALAMTVVSIPLLLDRHVGVPAAVATSLAVTRKNPVAVAKWGLIVTALLVVGTIPLFLGLIFVFPVLGHATWHLYRRAVKPPKAA